MKATFYSKVLSGLILLGVSAPSAFADDQDRWNWDQHNWDEQRTQLTTNWVRHDDRISEEEKRQLDDQLKTQWIEYHHNSWDGPYTWNQYSDPQFLDYVHSNNPTLMTRIRTVTGF